MHLTRGDRLHGNRRDLPKIPGVDQKIPKLDHAVAIEIESRFVPGVASAHPEPTRQQRKVVEIHDAVAIEIRIVNRACGLRVLAEQGIGKWVDQQRD